MFGIKAECGSANAPGSSMGHDALAGIGVKLVLSGEPALQRSKTPGASASTLSRALKTRVSRDPELLHLLSSTHNVISPFFAA